MKIDIMGRKGMMRIRKSRVISLVLVLMMGLSMSACGNEEITEELSTEKNVVADVDEPDIDIDSGVNITEENVTEAEPDPIDPLIHITENQLPAPLYDFLYCFDGYFDNDHKMVYDCTDSSGENNDLIGRLIGPPSCVQNDIYPYDEREEQWSENIDDISNYDPLGKWESQYRYFGKVSEKWIEWIALNIFNADPVILEKAKEGTEDYYYKDGYFYYSYGGMGWETPTITITDIIVYNNTFYITYEDTADWIVDEEIHKAVMVWKDIDGEGYWSMYSHDVDWNLPEEEETASDSNEPSVIEVPISSSPTHYEDDIISFDIPAGVGYKWYAGIEDVPEIISCYAMPDYYVKGVIIESHKGRANRETIEDLCKEPCDILYFETDTQHFLESIYDEDIPDAKIAADYRYNEYIERGYKKSDTEDIGCVGSFTTTIDGQTAYVVWNRGPDEEIFYTALYECFVDSPKGTIVEIDYTYLGEELKIKREEILASIKFK